jgi:SH3-like domain-containing protein
MPIGKVKLASLLFAQYKEKKMQRIFRFLLLTLVLLLSLNLTFAQSEGSSVRFVHVIPGVEDLDIYVNGTLAVSGLAYGESSTYISVSEGTLNVRATLAGLTSTMWEQPVVVPGGDKLTLVAFSTDPLNFTTYRDDPTPLGLGTGRIIVVYAVAGGSAAQFQVDGNTVIDDLQAGAAINSIDVPANVYQVQFVPVEGDDPIVEEAPLKLNSLTTQMMVVYGTSNNAETVTLTSATAPEGEAGFVRFAHGIADAPAVNIVVDDSLLIPSLEFGETTEHLAIPAGSYSVSVQNAENDEELLSADLDVTANAAQTVAALLDGDAPALGVFVDTIEGVESSQAVVSVINASGEEATVTLSDGTTLAEGLASGEASEAVSVAPTAGTINETDVRLYGGVYYNVFVLSNGQIVVAPTSLAQAIDSAPGASEAPVLVDADETDEPAAGVTQVAQATEEPQVTDEVTAATVEPTLPAATEAPTTAPQPTAAPTTAFPTARVVLDPGANLHLRQFPSSTALSLGRVPTGTVLNVNGREGAPVDRDGNVLPLEEATEEQEAVEWVDPVTLLEGEGGDLDPAETWLNVTYNTPDGGTVTAWVNALYLNVDDPRGFNQRLADLPTIPRNQEGVAQNTSMTSPEEPVEIVEAVVTQLDEGVNLNIRRTADETSEVLARVASGTVLQLIGLGASGDWAFVSYAPMEGGTVTGWANREYLRFEFRDAVIDEEEMAARELLEEVDEETLRGEVDGTTPVVGQPTRPPLRDVIVGTVIPLNDGILLNLRRNPNTQAEVVAKIPSGTSLVITSKDLSGEWLETEFEGVPGWVSTQYVNLSFNQQAFALDDVPLNEGLVAQSSATATETSDAPPPTETPDLTTTPTETPTPGA